MAVPALAQTGSPKPADPAQPAAAPAQSEQSLEDLIPDAALADPEAWAGAPDAAAPDAAAPDPVDAGDPATPLDEAAPLDIAWPDEASLPAFEPLTPDVDLADETGLDAEARAALAELEAMEEAQLASPVPTGGLPTGQSSPALADGAAGDGRIGEITSGPVTISFLGNTPLDPDLLSSFEARFDALSTLDRYRDSDDNIAQIARRAQSDLILIEQLMRIYGYYDAEIRQTVDSAQGTDNAADGRITFEVVTGPQYRLDDVRLGQLDATGADFPMLRARFGNQQGDPVNSDDITNGRIELDVALGENGYAFATIDEPELLIDHADRTGDLDMAVAPGLKYSFGSVTSNNERLLSGRHLSDVIARFEPGDPYQRSLVDDLRRAILATGLVSSVNVSPRAVEGAAIPTVDLDVAITQAPLRTIAGQAGYGTGEGFRVEASWEHRNLFPPEGALRVRGVLGTQEQTANITFRRNNFRRRDQVLTGDILIANVDRQAFAARTVQISASIERQTNIIFQKDWVWSAGVELLASDERDGEVGGVSTARRTFFIASLPLRLAYDGSDDLLDATRGFRAAIRLSPETSLQSGNVNYLRAQIDGSYYQPVNDRVVIAGRARFGSIVGASTASIAPSRRYYAGGGGSVRGFGFQEIGPRDSLNEPSGGRSLSEFSLEARVRLPLFDNSFSVVPFIDAGAVDDGSTPRLADLRFGAGIGVRYHTSFGPIRVDVGTPLGRRPGESLIGVYVSLGQAF